MRRPPAHALVALALASSVGCRRETPRADVRPTSVAPAPIPPPVAFARRPPGPGTRWQETADMHLRMEVRTDPGTGNERTNALETGASERHLVEVLEVRGDAPTKVRVTFQEKTESVRDDGGKERMKRSAVEKKTYVVEAVEGGAVAISDEKGKPAPAPEAKEIEAAFRTLGKPDAFVAAVPEAPIRIGDAVPSLAKALEQQMATIAEGATLSDARLVLAEVIDGNAVFDASLVLTVDDGRLRVTAELRGPLKVALATGWPTQMDVKGKVFAKGSGEPPARLEGRGEMGVSVHLAAQ